MQFPGPDCAAFSASRTELRMTSGHRGHVPGTGTGEDSVTTALPGPWSQDPPQRKAASGHSQCWGALSGHSAYLLGVAEHVALGAGDAKLQQPLLLLKKPKGAMFRPR